jgi:hypothetical protein
VDLNDRRRSELEDINPSLSTNYGGMGLEWEGDCEWWVMNGG